jgi:folate-binding protein YgfZ
VPEATALPELDAQYRALREEAGVLIRENRAVLKLKGPEAADYLQSQVTNEVESLKPGQGCYATLLDRKGHVQADMRVLVLHPEDLWLDAETAGADALRRHLQTYKIGRQVELEDVSEAWSILSLIGPAAAEVAGTRVPSSEHAQHHFQRDGVEALAVATGFGLDLIARADESERLRALLLGSGAHEVSEDAAEILRVESGRPRFGIDFGPESMPAEAGIVERAVDFEKGCYIGQEPVARLHYRGKPNRSLCGLRLSAPAERGARLRLEEREVGALGTSVVSPRYGPIALAVVRREAQPGDVLRVGEGEIEATVAPSPAFSRDQP